MQLDVPGTAAPSLHLLGPLKVSRAGVAVVLPPSRKVRALLAYLVMAGRPLTRSHLCELLWDVPSDPRGELRWCLSKLRAVLDDPTRMRVQASADTVVLDLADCNVDVSEIVAAVQQGVASQPPERLAAIDSLFGSHDFLEGLDLPRSPAFTGWLTAERRRLRGVHAAVLEHWVQALPLGSDQALAAAGRWLAIGPVRPACARATVAGTGLAWPPA